MQRQCENVAEKVNKNWLGPSIIKVDEQTRQLKAQTGFSVAQGEAGCLSLRGHRGKN